MDGESAACDRLFYSLPENKISANDLEKNDNQKPKDILQFIAENIIGRGKVFSGPFGLRKGWLISLSTSCCATISSRTSGTKFDSESNPIIHIIGLRCMFWVIKDK